MINKFTDLILWRKAHQLALEVYRVSGTFPDSEKFGLVSQMRRSAVSVPANVAEGFSRATLKDQKRFYNIADASLAELKYYILLAADLKYFDNEVKRILSEHAREVGKILGRWMKGPSFSVF